MSESDGVVTCDCGYVARGTDDAEIVALAQAHSKEVHDIDLPAELILARVHARAERGISQAKRRKR